MFGMLDIASIATIFASIVVAMYGIRVDLKNKA